MVRLRIRDVAFECDETRGIAKVTTPTEQVEFPNAIEAWNAFTARALAPLEKELRDAIERYGYNRWTGTKEVEQNGEETLVGGRRETRQS